MQKLITKILLIVPPQTLPTEIEFCGINEPLGILYIAASLRKAGYDVKVIDFNIFDQKRKRSDAYITYGANVFDIKENLKLNKPDLIGVSCLHAASEFDLFETCKIIKSVHPSVPVVVGGGHPSVMPERMLARAYIDYVIIGEGEFRLRYLIEALNKKNKFFQFDGIAFKKSGKTFVHRCASVIEDLDVLPLPARDMIDVKAYSYINKKNRIFTNPGVLIEATRGCFNCCTYCSVSKTAGQTIRFRSVQNVINEIKLLKNIYGIKNICFVEDNIAVNKKYILALCAALTKIHVHPQFNRGIWPDVLDSEVIAAMAKAGIRTIIFSVSSSSKRVLKDIMHRQVTIERVPELVQQCRKHNIGAIAQFVLGMIGEKKRELLQSLNYPIKVGFDGAVFYSAFPFPGTELYNQAKEKGYLPERFNYRRAFFSQTPILQIPETSPDFSITPQQFKNLVMKKNLILRRQLLRRISRQQSLGGKSLDIGNEMLDPKVSCI